LCPKEIDSRLAQRLLGESEAHGDRRFAVHQGKAYCARRHGPKRWHGFPVGWQEVPEKLRREWLKSGRLTKQDVRNHWN
jgi:hypothetical protein